MKRRKLIQHLQMHGCSLQREGSRHLCLRGENLNNSDRALLIEFKKRIPSDIEHHLKRLIVFGSRAKDQAVDESDLDVVALVDKKTPELERRLDDIAYQVMWDHDFQPILSLKVLEESRFNIAVGKGLSFYRNVEKEGITV